MRNFTKISILTTALLMGAATKVFADIPDSTVVIGNNAYDINYVNNEENSEEIRRQFVNSQGRIYFKSFDSNWYSVLTQKPVDKDIIPTVNYIDSKGNTYTYGAKDGIEIKLQVESAAFINSNQVEVKFSKKVDTRTALNRKNYKVGKEFLGPKDSVSLMGDRQTIRLTLHNNLDNENLNSKIFISKDILDLNKESMTANYERDIVILNKEYSTYTSAKEINGDINVIGDNVFVEKVTVKGNIHFNGDQGLLNNSIVKGHVAVDPGEKGSAYITDTSLKEIKILSGANESIYLKNVKSDSLKINSKKQENNLRVKINGKSSIDSVEVMSGASLEVEETSVLSKLAVFTKNSNDKIELSGNFDLVKVNREAKIHLLKGKIAKLVANEKTELNASEKAVLPKLDNEETMVTVNIVKEEVTQEPVISNGLDKLDKPYLKDAYIVLDNNTKIHMDITDELKATIDLSDMEGRFFTGILMNTSKKQCKCNIFHIAFSKRVVVEKETTDGTIEITKEDKFFSEHDNNNDGASLISLRQVTEEHFDGKKITIRGELVDNEGNSNKIQFDIIVNK